MASHLEERAPGEGEAWPVLPLEEWKDTYATLHMWSQIVGKVRLALSPMVNHWWQVPFYVTPRGLTTSAIPYGNRSFEILFDFIDHRLAIQDSDGRIETLALAPRSVADFYLEVTALLRALKIDVKIWPVPVEVPNPIPFAEDRGHASYDGERAHTFWRVLATVDAVFKQFRGGFIGKCSPVHFFWGSFDLAVTRFSGRRAPERPGADRITREAYSHEVISHGFWPGGGEVQGAAFYAYAAPEPPGLREHPVRPGNASYNSKLGEFILTYNDVRTAQTPERALLEFLKSTYEAGATLARWDRAALERSDA